MGGTGPSKIEKDFEQCGEELPERYLGFENKDNICYANSVLQALYFCQDFRKYLINQKIASRDTVMSQLQELYTTMITSKRKTGVMSTKNVMSKCKVLNELFDNDDHHDSHEFLIWLINRLDEELKAQGSQSWVQQLFEGKFTTQTKCLCCQNVTHRDEVFMDLSLDVKQNCSILSSLKRYSEIETLSGADKFYCETCACKQEAQTRTLIKDPPNILICHLKRFKYSDELRRYTKLSYRVAFPSQLRLNNTVDNCPEKLYELFACIVHLGPGFQYGHYMAIVKSHGHWIRFDDDYVEKVDEALIQHIFGSSKEIGSVPCGYILFYRATF